MKFARSGSEHPIEKFSRVAGKYEPHWCHGEETVPLWSDFLIQVLITHCFQVLCFYEVSSQEDVCDVLRGRSEDTGERECMNCSRIRSASGSFFPSGNSRTCRASVTHVPLSCSSSTASASWSSRGSCVCKAEVFHGLQQGLSSNREGPWHVTCLWSWRHKIEIYMTRFTSLECRLMQWCAKRGESWW